MPTWVAVYGIAVSLCSMGAVLMMGRMMKAQRRVIRGQQQVLLTTVCGAANMWDTLTPEQIRSLHPNTVEVGNGLPPWDSAVDWFDKMHFQMRTEQSEN